MWLVQPIVMYVVAAVVLAALAGAAPIGTVVRIVTHQPDGSRTEGQLVRGVETAVRDVCRGQLVHLVNCSGAFARFFQQLDVAVERERERAISTTGKSREQRQMDAEDLVSKMFTIDDRTRIESETARVSASRRLGKEEKRLEKEARAACRRQFKGDDGSVVRCLVQHGFLVSAERAAEECVSPYPPGTHLDVYEENVYATVVLCSFARGLLHEWLRPLASAERAQLWTQFQVYSASTHRFNAQLGLLYIYAAMSRQRGDSNYPAHWLVLPKETPFLISTLDPARDSNFAMSIDKSGEWESDFTPIFQHALKEQDLGLRRSELCVVDVGANVGWFSLLSATMGFRVIAFEPVPDHCRRLRESMALNAFDLTNPANGAHIELHECIASTRKKPLRVRRFLDGPSSTAYVVPEKDDSHDEDDDVVVPARRVDGVGIAGARAVAAIKIDAEGCEIDALNSASALLFPQATRPPELFLELCPYVWKRCGTTVKQERKAWELLRKANYSIYLHHHDRGFESCPTLPKSMHLEELELDVGEAASSGNRRVVMYRSSLTKDTVRELMAWTALHGAGGGSSEVTGCFQVWATQRDTALRVPLVHKDEL